MKKICKYCETEIEFDSNKQFGAHLTNCKSNPSKIERDNKSRKRKEYNFICKCGKIYSIFSTPDNIKKSKYKKFCSRTCANSRNHSESSKNKISKTLSKGIKLYQKICKECDNEFETRRKQQIYCSRKCSTPFKNPEIGKMAGRKSVVAQNRRSKNEIAFFEMCKSKFNKVLSNEPIFNGWDADIIIEDIKVAILWNGVWHYKKISEGHSIKQVRNRDKIKIEEIKKCGYVPYVIKDLGKFDSEKVESEWQLFNLWLIYNKLH